MTVVSRSVSRDGCWSMGASSIVTCTFYGVLAQRMTRVEVIETANLELTPSIKAQASRVFLVVLEWGEGHMAIAITRRRWAFQNLLIPLLPWAISIGVAFFWLQHPEWQFLSISSYLITMTLIAFYMGLTIARLTEIVPGEFDAGDISYKSQKWYVAAFVYGIAFAVYDILGLRGDVHHWIYGRIADIAVIFVGVLTLMLAYSSCKALKLDTRP